MKTPEKKTSAKKAASTTPAKSRPKAGAKKSRVTSVAKKSRPKAGAKKSRATSVAKTRSAKSPGKSSAKRVFIFGAGKVGRGLARELTRVGYAVMVRAARAGLPRKQIDATIVILSVRDRALTPLADEMAEHGTLREDAVVLHNAGALGAEALSPLRAFTAGVAQFHPMISFAAKTFTPTLARGNAHIQGDPGAVRAARDLALALSLTPRTIPKLDTIGYHAAAGLVANGTAALAAIGAELLARSGVPKDVAPKMLGPLLRSVAENVEALGFPEALTGPVRRGDAASIQKQIGLLREKLPAALPLFIASVAAQLPLAKMIGEAPADAFEAIADGMRAELHALTANAANAANAAAPAEPH